MMDLMRKDSGSARVTILLVEHDMQAVMGLCDRITVLSFGRLAGSRARRHEIRSNPRM